MWRNQQSVISRKRLWSSNRVGGCTSAHPSGDPLLAFLKGCLSVSFYKNFLQ